MKSFLKWTALIIVSLFLFFWLFVFPLVSMIGLPEDWYKYFR